MMFHDLESAERSLILLSDSDKELIKKKDKKYYDQKVRHVQLMPGDRVLIRKVGLKGKQKLADIWDREPYIVKRQPIPDIPVYEVQLEYNRRKSKLLHRNMLLPFNGLPVPKEVKHAKTSKDIVVEVSDDPYQADKSSTSSEESSEVSERYVIPQRRNLKEKQKIRTYNNRGKYDDDNTDSVPETATPVRISQHDSNSDSYSSESSQVSSNSRLDTVRRGVRQKRPPLWMRTGQWQV